MKAKVSKMTHFRHTAPVHGEGLRNRVDVTGSASGRVGCYEMVWADGVQYRMTFSNQQFAGATPSDKIAPFYVLTPQTDTPQDTLPFLHGYFLLCSAEGVTSGGCASTMTSIDAGPLTLVDTGECSWARSTPVSSLYPFQNENPIHTEGGKHMDTNRQVATARRESRRRGSLVDNERSER